MNQPHHQYYPPNQDPRLPQNPQQRPKSGSLPGFQQPGQFPPQQQPAYPQYQGQPPHGGQRNLTPPPPHGRPMYPPQYAYDPQMAGYYPQGGQPQYNMPPQPHHAPYPPPEGTHLPPQNPAPYMPGQQPPPGSYAQPYRGGYQGQPQTSLQRDSPSAPQQPSTLPHSNSQTQATGTPSMIPPHVPPHHHVSAQDTLAYVQNPQYPTPQAPQPSIAGVAYSQHSPHELHHMEHPPVGSSGEKRHNSIPKPTSAVPEQMALNQSFPNKKDSQQPSSDLVKSSTNKSCQGSLVQSSNRRNQNEEDLDDFDIDEFASDEKISSRSPYTQEQESSSNTPHNPPEGNQQEEAKNDEIIPKAESQTQRESEQVLPRQPPAPRKSLEAKSNTILNRLNTISEQLEESGRSSMDMSLQDGNIRFLNQHQQIVEIKEEDPREEEAKAPSSMPVSNMNSPRGGTMPRTGNSLLADACLANKGQPQRAGSEIFPQSLNSFNRSTSHIFRDLEVKQKNFDHMSNKKGRPPPIKEEDEDQVPQQNPCRKFNLPPESVPCRPAINQKDHLNEIGTFQSEMTQQKVKIEAQLGQMVRNIYQEVDRRREDLSKQITHHEVHDPLEVAQKVAKNRESSNLLASDIPIASNTTKTYETFANQRSSDNKLSPGVNKSEMPPASPDAPKTPPAQLKVMHQVSSQERRPEALASNDSVKADQPEVNNPESVGSQKEVAKPLVEESQVNQKLLTAELSSSVIQRPQISQEKPKEEKTVEQPVEESPAPVAEQPVVPEKPEPTEAAQLAPEVSLQISDKASCWGDEMQQKLYQQVQMMVKNIKDIISKESQSGQDVQHLVDFKKEFTQHIAEYVNQNLDVDACPNSLERKKESSKSLNQVAVVEEEKQEEPLVDPPANSGKQIDGDSSPNFNFEAVKEDEEDSKKVLNELIQGLEDRNHVNMQNLIDNLCNLEGQMEEIAQERKGDIREECAHPSLDFMIKIIKVVYVLFATQSKHDFTMRHKVERQLNTSYSSNSPRHISEAVKMLDSDNKEKRHLKICRHESFGPGCDNSPSQFLKPETVEESKTAEIPKKDLPLVQRSNTTFPRLFNVFTGQFPYNRSNQVGCANAGILPKGNRQNRKNAHPFLKNNTIRVSGGNKRRVIGNQVKRKMPSLIEIGDLSPQSYSITELGRIDSMASAKQHFRQGFIYSFSQNQILNDLTQGSIESRNPNFGPYILEKTSFRGVENADDTSSVFSTQKELGMGGNTKVKYLTHDEIIGQDNQVYWTDFQFYQYERDEAFIQQQQSLARTCQIKNCLVIEPVNQFFKLIDPSKDKFNMNEVKQFKCMIGDQPYIAVVKIWPKQLLAHLRKLSRYYEIVIYSILPIDILKQIYSLHPELKDVINHTLSYENLIYENNYACKDLGYLYENRIQNMPPEDGEEATPSEIMVIDSLIGADCSDSQCVTYFQGHPYQGDMNYQNMQYIIESLRQYRAGAWVGQVQGEDNEGGQAENDDSQQGETGVAEN